MRVMVKIIFFLLTIMLLGGCSNERGTASKKENENQVDKVINEQISKSEEGLAEKDLTEEVEETLVEEDEKNPNYSTDNTIPEHGFSIDEEEISSIMNENESGDVDYNLTNINSDMVYSVVFQMMMDPDSYIGKTFRIEGIYYAVYYEPTEKYYHYCIIEDALACCAQGIEFVWEDGSHIYPDEYPQDNTKIVVEGTFETYRDEGDSNLYAHLTYSTLSILGDNGDVIDLSALSTSGGEAVDIFDVGRNRNLTLKESWLMDL